MKKIFTLMWAIVCAALTIVSCTPDTPQDDPQGPTYTSTITVTGAPEANLTPEAGELSLGYAIENATLTDALVVTTEAAWVKVGEIGEATVALTYEANTDAPGSPAREAVIKFAYKGAEDVLVTLKQDSQAPSFTVEFSEITANEALVNLTVVNPEMDWVALAVASSNFADFGATTPAEYIAALCNEAASMGVPYLFLVNQLYSNSGSMGKGTPTEPFMVMKGWQAKPEDKLYLFVLGYNVDADLNMWEYDNSTLATPAHIFEVPLLPAPSLTIAEDQLSQNVSAAAGEVVVDYVLENAVEGVAVEAWTEATWLTPSCADGKLTIAYEANTAAVARRAVVSVGYGDLLPIELTVVQEKDANAVAITLNIEVTGTQFNGIWVNVTPSDKEVTYAMNYTNPEKDWETGAELEMDWMGIAEGLLSYTGNATFHKGDLTNYFIKMNPSNYEWYGYDYYVYAVAVTATSEEGVDYNDNPKTTWTVSEILSDVYSVKTTIDASKMPKLEWDLTKNPELVWNKANERYDLEVVEGSTVVLHFNVINPVEGAVVALNGTSLYDSYNVVDGEPVVDNAAGTITLKIDKFDTAKSYHYIQPTFKYTNAEGDTWGITTPNLRLTQVEAPAPAEKFSKIEKVEDLTAGEYYMAGYLTEYTYNNTTNDWSATPYHIAQGYGTSSGKTDLYTTPYAYTGGDLVMKAGESYAAKITTLEAVEGKANTYYVKLDGKYLYSASAANRQLGGGDEPKEWVASNGAKGGIYLTSVENPVILGTAGATSKILRSYTDDSNLKYGLVFFKENK